MPIKFLLTTILLLAFQTTVLAENCVIIVLGGAKQWLTLAPGIPTDISIDVDIAIKKEARKTGCHIFSMENNSEGYFYKNLRELKSPPYNKPGTKYHIALADHGPPPAKAFDRSVMITGVGHFSQ